ncbi:MAG: tetratricopeptide repeat protein [Chlorobium sp.]
MITPCLMFRKTGKLSANRYRLIIYFYALFCAISCCILLSSCSSRPALSGSSQSDSLAQASTREFVAASLLSAQGNYRSAANRYLKLLTVEPSNAAIHYALSKAYLSLGVLDSARIYSEKSVLLNPGNKYYLSVLAGLAHQMHDYTRASDLYRQIVALEPGSVEPLSSLALEYLAADQPEKALAVFKDILSIDPKDKTAQAQVLLMEIKLLHYKDAIKRVMELIRQGDEKDKLRLTLGELYIQAGDFDLAFKTFREVVHENPRFIPAWLGVFEVSVQSKNQSVFLEYLNRLNNTSQISFKQKIELAKLFVVRSVRDSSFVQPSITMIDEIGRRNKNNSLVYVLRGNAKILHGKGLDAIPDFKKALQLEPKNVEMWENLVSAYLMQKDYLHAERTVSKAKSRFPSLMFRLRVLEGEVQFQAGNLKQAVLLLEPVARPKTAKKDKQLYEQAVTSLALCYDKLGFPDKSIHLYETILQTDSKNYLMMNNLAYVLSVQEKELIRAKDLALKAVTAEPDNASYLDTLGWVLFKLKEYEKARDILEKALGIDTTETEIMDHLSQVYDAIGNSQKSQEMKEKIKKLLKK